ncbi:MAG: flagellar hook-length control protein FliK [Planctomycetota bacterium]
MAPILPNLLPNLPTPAAPRAQTPADRARTDRSEFHELLGRERGAERGRGLKLGHDPEHRAIGRRRKEDACICPGDEPATPPTTPVDDAPATDAPIDPPTDAGTDGTATDGGTGDLPNGATNGSAQGDTTGSSADAAVDASAGTTPGSTTTADGGTVAIGAPGDATTDATIGVKIDPAATGAPADAAASSGSAATSTTTTDGAAPTGGSATATTTITATTTPAPADLSSTDGGEAKTVSSQGATATANPTTTTTTTTAAAASDASAEPAAAAANASTGTATAATSTAQTATPDAARAANANDPLARLVEAGQAAIRDTRRAPESATAGRLAEVEASIARDRVRAATGMPAREGDADGAAPTVPGEGLALGLARAPGLARDAAALPKGLASGFSAAMGAELADDAATPAAAQLAAKGAELLANQRGGTITMRLDPPELGAMRIEIRIAQGAVFADFEAQNPEARALLESNLSMLRRRLESQGLAVERLTVHGGLRGTDAAQPGSRQDGSETRQQGSDGRERGEGSGTRQDAAGGESRGRRDGDAAEGRERMDMRSRRGESGGFAGVLGGIEGAPGSARRAG